MDLALLERPLFYIGRHYITFLGLIAFVGLFATGLIVARILQSQFVRRFFARFKIDTNFIAIVTTILSLAALVFFTISAINAAGIPLAWNAPLPAVSLSLLQIFLLIALLVVVFWISSRMREALLAAGRENPNTLKEPAPSVFLEKFGDSSIDFELVVWSSEMSARPSRYRSDLNFAIEQKFREAEIEIAFPQRDLHIRSGVLKVEGAGGQEATKRDES